MRRIGQAGTGETQTPSAGGKWHWNWALGLGGRGKNEGCVVTEQTGNRSLDVVKGGGRHKRASRWANQGRWGDRLGKSGAAASGAAARARGLAGRPAVQRDGLESPRGVSRLYDRRGLPANSSHSASCAACAKRRSEQHQHSKVPRYVRLTQPPRHMQARRDKKTNKKGEKPQTHAPSCRGQP